jgi:hypothetical protein
MARKGAEGAKDTQGFFYVTLSLSKGSPLRKRAQEFCAEIFV